MLRRAYNDDSKLLMTEKMILWTRFDGFHKTSCSECLYG